MLIKRWIYKKFLKRARLKKWLFLENTRNKIAEDKANADTYICSYLSSAICTGKWDKLPWLDVAQDYVYATDLNSPSHSYPIFTQSTTKESTRLEYENWLWYMWANLIASTYGWSLEYISNLDLDDVICLIQEILIDDQSGKEWEWSLSEKSVSYDKRTKKAKFVPLDKPKWMKGEVARPAKKVVITKSMIPAGVIVGKASDVKH